MTIRPARASTIALAALLAAAAPAPVEEFRPLVVGDDPAQFELVGLGPEAIRIADGEIRLVGRPNGYFATRQSYRNYALKFEWMYERPEGSEADAGFKGNSGLLVHIAGEPKVWPKCVEVQLAYADAGHIFAINGSKFAGMKDAAAQKRATRPVGEWNEEEVVCQDGAITCTLNGVVVGRGSGATPDSGPIGWQSEGSPIRFRKLALKPLD